MSMFRGSFGTKTAQGGFLRLSTGRPARQSEPVVPMINVVFLLLIFFLMSAEIAPPEPFDMELPQTAADTAAEPGVTLFLSQEGLIAFGDMRGAAAITAALVEAGPEAPVNLRADARAEATTLARLLGDLAQAGAAEVLLVTEEAAQ
jgi:biopolymer transport protein ExbD